MCGTAAAYLTPGVATACLSDASITKSLEHSHALLKHLPGTTVLCTHCAGLMTLDVARM